MQSMTGFESFSQKEDFLWTWTLRSVNSKGLDLRLKLPLGFEELEQKIRQEVKEFFTRGTISISLEIKEEAQNQAYHINEDFLKKLCSLSESYAKDYPDLQPARLDGLLNVDGVVKQTNNNALDKEKMLPLLLESFKKACLGLKDSRQSEGDKMAVFLNNQIDEMENLLNQALKLACLQPQSIKETLQKQLSRIKEDVEINEERFMQEVCLCMLRADVTEELDRIKAHLQTARELFKQKTVIGRKLDFLSQELNREVNTLCSKSSEIELTTIGLSLKTVIDKFKEQIQNIE